MFGTVEVDTTEGFWTHPEGPGQLVPLCEELEACRPIAATGPGTHRSSILKPKPLFIGFGV